MTKDEQKQFAKKDKEVNGKFKTRNSNTRRKFYKQCNGTS